MGHRKIIMSLISSIILCLPSVSSGQAIECHFSMLSSEEGLSQNTVASIVQDKDGNIWAGTYDGLNRYDGYDIYIYRHNPADSTTIQSNIINKVYRDSGDEIWVCTANGLSLYDRMADRFRRVEMNDIHSVEDMIEISAGKYLVTTRSASFIYDMETWTLEEFMLDGKPFRFYSSCKDGENIVLCTMLRTVETMHLHKGSLIRKYPPVTITNFGRAVIPAGEDTYTIGTNGSGVLKVNVKAGTVTETAISSGTISAIASDRYGNIWTGGSEGLTAYSDTACIYNSWSQAPIDKAVRSIYSDTGGGLWVGTEYGGIKYWNSGKDRFSSINFKDVPSELGNGITTSLGIAPDGNVWIGSRYCGLSRFDPEDGHRTRYDIDNVQCLHFSEDGRYVYAGAEMNGLTVIDTRTGQQSHYERPMDVMDICPAKDGKLWIGTLVGLYLFSPEDGAYGRIKLPSSELITRVLTLFCDSSGNLWVGSKESIRVYRIQDGNSLEDISPSSLKGIIQVQCIHQTNDGTLWIGTADGMVTFRWDNMGVTTRIEELQGVTIRGIEEDSEENLWISTDNYLCRYNAGTQDKRIYTLGDGLQCKQFRTGVHCRSADGTLYFGGIKGVDCFRPENMGNNTSTIAPILSGLMLNNMDVRPSDNTGILPCSIRYASDIILKHYQNSITFRFSCPDFISGHGNSFRYKLEGFDTRWIEARNREATYSNLDKGKYVFRVMAANSDGIWHPEAAELNVRVLPVWYRTVIAKVFLCLLILSAIVFAGARILQNVNLRHEKRIEEMTRKYEEKIRRARLDRFIDPGYQLRPQDESFLTAVLTDIENNCSDPDFSVEALASAVYMSRGNLHLKVKTITGKSPIELIRAIRMEKACDLLRENRLSITEIAEQSGFQTSSYFITAFKKTFGTTPGKFASMMK